MQIKVNGRPLEIAATLTVEGLLEQLGYQDHFVAVAVNETCIPRRSYGEHRLGERDTIEILAPMAGG